MTYTKYYNKVRKEWWVFSNTATGSELVKVFKTEGSADKWIAKHI